MTSAELLTDAFGRVQEEVHAAVAGLDPDQLAHRIDPDANSIGWLIWHLSRNTDDHVAHVGSYQQAWTADGWAERFALPFRPGDTGYGHTSDQVAEVRVPADLLTGYYDAVHARVIPYVSALIDADLPRIVDTSWNPPVTLAVRLISTVSDALQHIGQAAYLRGHLLRR